MPCLGIPGGPTVEKVALDRNILLSWENPPSHSFKNPGSHSQPLIGCKRRQTFLHLAGFIMASNILTKRYLPQTIVSMDTRR